MCGQRQTPDDVCWTPHTQQTEKILFLDLLTLKQKTFLVDFFLRKINNVLLY